MSLPTPEEFKNKLHLTGGAIVYIIVASFSMGIMFAGLMGAKQDIVDDRKEGFNFTEQEVGGLRSDWERQNEQTKMEREELLDRIEELEEYHKRKP